MSGRNRHPPRLRVKIKYVTLPDAEDRLRCAFDILLGPALSTNHEVQTEKEEPPRQVPAEDTLTGGSQGGNST